MKISFLQQDIIWGSPRENHAHIEEILDNQEGIYIKDTDLLVLPEMFSTGFVVEPEGIAETNDLTLNWMKEQSRKRGYAICGSVSILKGGKYLNRFYFVSPTGEFWEYDKRHVFTFGGEGKYYTKGEERTIIHWKGVSILPQICYDLRFPSFIRNSMQEEKALYDLIIYVANWPEVRIGAWSTLLRARAIENQCYVLGVNRCGDDPGNHYNGLSAAVDPYGRTICECAPWKEQLLSFDLDLSSLKEFRKTFPVLKDAD